MESKNLNDIVIEDNDNSKKTQLKNILTLLALLFIILVISIVITKLILGSDDETQSETNITSTATESASALSNTATAAVAAVAAGTVATVAATTGGLTGSKSKESDGNAKDTTKKPLLTERNTTSRKKPTLRDHRVKTTTAPKTSSSSKSTPTKKVKTKTYVPKKKNPTVRKKTPAPKKRTTASATRGYYIKVGAFKDPSSAIRSIKAKQLRYKKVNTKNGMLTRVLVGPYYSQKDAQNDLAKVKKIAAGAYITKIK